ncbi:MAG: ribosome silencing factor, partial [Prevotella sp.]|nr:ribosome silencing factor [Prevotella sp.]
MTTTKQLTETIIKAIQEKKGRNIVVADLTAIEGAIAECFIICEGNSPTQVDAIAGEISDYCLRTTGEKPAHCVGLDNAIWVAIDFTDVMVHVFVPDARTFYD